MRRLVLQFAIASLIPVLVLGWWVSAATRHSIEDRSTALYGETTANIVRLGASVLFDADDFAVDAPVSPAKAASIDAFLHNLQINPDELHMLAVNPRGVVVYSNFDGAPTTQTTDGDIAVALANGRSADILRGSNSRTHKAFDGRLVESTVPIRFGNGPVVGAVVFGAVDEDFIGQVDEDVAELRRVLAVGLALLWLLMIPILLRVSRRLRRQAQENEYLALHDTLTSLPNRDLLEQRLAQAIEDADRESASVGLLLIDLDRFKEVNDTLGHRAGDQLLRDVASRLRDATRVEETVARLGGDEFAIVVRVARGQDVLPVVERVMQALRRPIPIEGIDLAVEASIGIALYPEDAASADSLLQHADIAMYAAKATGDRHAVYAAEFDSHTPSRLELAGELRRVLTEDRDQLVLHFQPVATSAGRVVALEALVRWQHPRRGLLEPDAFLPIAERSGMIHALTAHVLDGAVAQAVVWADRGFDVAVATNLSARDLRDSTIVDRVRTVLDRHGLDPRRLELEVTETAVLESPDRANQLADQLRALGVRIALDDFGTGHSSLTNLKRLRPDRLKIDRMFVATMADDPTDAAIVQSIVQLAHGLRIGVTAEGVETRAQWDLLDGLGCDLLQGHHLSPALPAAEATAWLEARAVRPG